MIDWRKYYGDLETWVVTGVVLIHQSLKLRDLFKGKGITLDLNTMTNDDKFKRVYEFIFSNSDKIIGVNASSIASTVTATTQAASDNSTKIATTAYVTTAVSNLVDGAPSALNTLNELAAALDDNANIIDTPDLILSFSPKNTQVSKANRIIPTPNPINLLGHTNPS